MKQFIFILLLAFTAFACNSCTCKPFDRIESTELEQYSIVYKDGSCGVYDNAADSLVTALKYDALRYNRTAVEDGLEISVWRCELDSCLGMLAIEHSTNETMEIIFPK